MAETKANESSAAAEAKPRRRVTKRKAVEEHVRSYFDAIARRDVEAMTEYWVEEAVTDVVPLGVLRGRDEIMAFFREVFGALPDVTITVTNLVAAERNAAVEWRLSGHFTGSAFRGMDATGRAVALRGFDLFEIEDGKNLGATVYYDGMDFARQVGMMPQQDSGAERAMLSAFNAATRLRKAVAERRGTS